ncbi:MAG: T9SS type A sorting domain-containing protein [Saprospiraceae bacterium]|nr:T9SS type A sorting domain-containing protein [Saprospiraceae bacterium]
MYMVTVTDSASCTATDSVLIAQPNEIIVEAEIEDLLCGEANTGSIILSATGGFPPFEYNWSNESDSPVLSDLDEGVYVVTVTDATGCFIVNSYDVANPGNPECNVNVTRVVSTPAAMDGEASVTVIGGVAPYTYEWGNGQTGVSADSLGVGDYSVTVTDAKGCSTSCSIAITPSSALLGDYVWLDEDYDGFQDTTEAGIPGIEVILTPLGECDTLPMDTTFTDETGFYSFVVEPCAYKLTFVVPDSLSITVPNNTQNRELDSDIDRLTAMTDTILIEAGETDYSWDAGLVPSPTSYFLDPCNCLNNATNDENGQFGDLFIVINGLPGDDWIITEIVNMFDVDSPEPPALPIPVLPGDTLQEFSFGEYRMPFRVVDNQPYSITVTNGIDTITEGGLCIYPDIEVVNIPSDTIDLCLTGGIFIPDLLPSIPGDLEILLDGVPINEVDPLQLGEGIYTLEVNLFPTDEAECIATTIRTIIIGTAGCPAKLGDFVWLDTNENGLQDAGEPGVSNVQVILQAPDGSPLDTTTTDNTGMYMFMVEAGEYKLTFDKLSNYEFTIPNAGDDLLDSDVDPATMMTLVVSLEEGEINNSLDAGFITPCINVTDPGEIGFDQMVCGPGNDPDALVSVRGASGGEGELEYLWMYSVETETFNMGLFTPIPNSNSETYDPGPLFETTWFARCARRVGCPGFLEPELVEITVKEDAIADITGPNVVCYTEEATYQVESKTGDPDDILWEFPLGVTSSSDSDDEVTLSFASFGQYTIQVSVTENGCTAIGTKKIVVTTNSDYCDGSDFGIEVSAVNQDKEVMVKWDMLDDSQRYIFDVEHAADGENYIVIAQVDEPNRIVDGVKYYEYMDLSPKVGRNYYRVKVANPNGEVSYSEAIELRLGQTEAKMLVYPNPAQESVTIEFLEEMPTRMEIELINANGKTLRSFLVGGETINQPIDLNGLPAGLYFLRVKMSREDTEVIKLWKAEE